MWVCEALGTGQGQGRRWRDACPVPGPRCTGTGQRELQEGIDRLKGPSPPGPSRGCRGEKSSSWKTTTKPSLQYAGHSHDAIQGPHQLPSLERPSVTSPRPSSPVHVYPYPRHAGLVKGHRAFPSVGSGHLTASKPLLPPRGSEASSRITTFRPPRPGQRPLCSLLHLFTLNPAHQPVPPGHLLS